MNANDAGFWAVREMCIADPDAANYAQLCAAAQPYLQPLKCDFQPPSESEVKTDIDWLALNRELSQS